jgi:hypothetical protein
MRLFHFSDDPGIVVFSPRAVQVPSPRAPGRDWLNGPLVWAIDDWHQPMFLFPRDCPRILLWPLATTTAEDLKTWYGGSSARIVAHVEAAWLDRLRQTPIHRYELPPESFESLDDAGMWVSRETVTPIAMETITDLPAALRAQDVELRVMERLGSLQNVWLSSLHASGSRLRNAQDWPGPPKLG